MVWQEVIAGSHVWVYEYLANGYRVNAIALPLNENDWAIVSPPIGLSEADFMSINTKGQVTALITPSAAHDLGQAEWQTRYPDATPYAPTAALSQLKQVERPFMPLSELAASGTEFREVPGTKKGGTIAISHHGTQSVVYLDELVINWASLPNNWTNLLFRLTGSAPGLRINQIYKTLFCPDLPAVAQTVVDALEGDPAIVPAHGVPLVQAGDAARIRELVKPLAKPA